MDINVDLNDVIAELLEQNKALNLENILLKKALEQVQAAKPYTYEEPEHHKVL
jgi:regulator of replication initiation timing